MRGTTAYSAREVSERRQIQTGSGFTASVQWIPNYVTASSWVKELFPNVSCFGPQRFSSADFNCSKSLPTERACDHSKLKELQKLCRPESPISRLLSAAALHFSQKYQGESQTPVNTVSEVQAGVTEIQPNTTKTKEIFQAFKAFFFSGLKY